MLMGLQSGTTTEQIRKSTSNHFEKEQKASFSPWRKQSIITLAKRMASEEGEHALTLHAALSVL
jgi:hypothetical protein